MTKLEYEVKLNDIKNKIKQAEQNEDWTLAASLINSYNKWHDIANMEMGLQKVEKEFERYKQKVERKGE